MVPADSPEGEAAGTSPLMARQPGEGLPCRPAACEVRQGFVTIRVSFAGFRDYPVAALPAALSLISGRAGTT
jgi:hypothetical protein